MVQKGMDRINLMNDEQFQRKAARWLVFWLLLTLAVFFYGGSAVAKLLGF